jgi:cytochrome d ubiquinol oxidase subunit I
MLFGMDRVSPRLHLVSCMVVALGAMLSAFWILAANSWMQTPAGFTVADGKFQLASWWDAIFSPSFPYRLSHMVVAAYTTGAFLVAGVSGFYLWRARHLEFARAGFSIALWLALILVPLQLLLGDLHGRNTLDYQPIKVAAMEGDWETRAGQPLVLFAWPDAAAERNAFAFEIPRFGSLILTHDWNGEVKGLKAVPPSERPPVAVVFFAFRLMVGIWVALFAIAIIGVWLRWRGRLYDTVWFSGACALASPLPFIAILSGWTVTEVGRQPYVVYGYLRTADAVSPVSAPAVLSSLTLFVIVYTVLLLAFFLYAWRTIERGPEIHEPALQPSTVRPGVGSALIAGG